MSSIRFEASEYDFKLLARNLRMVFICIALIGPASILFFDWEGMGLFTTFFLMAISIIFLPFVMYFLYHKLVGETYKNLDRYFFEINGDELIFAHPLNKDNSLPIEFHFCVDEIRDIKEMQYKGMRSIKLEVKKPKYDTKLDIFGYKDMDRLSSELHKIVKLHQEVVA